MLRSHALAAQYPWHHLLALLCVTLGAFFLGTNAAAKGAGGSSKNEKQKGTIAVKMLGPLPIGSWYILLNCVIYGFTSRMDRVAIDASSKNVYYAYGRLMMAAAALASSSGTQITCFTTTKVQVLTQKWQAGSVSAGSANSV